MSIVVKVATVASSVPVVGEIADLVKEIASLYEDVKASSPMFVDLVQDVKSDEPAIQELLDGNKFQSVSALDEYKALLLEVKLFLEAYREKSILRRLLGNGKTKDRIHQFYAQRARIAVRMGLQFQEAGATRLERIEEANKRMEQRFHENFEKLFRVIEENKGNLTKVIGQDGELVDLKYEVKYNRGRIPEAQFKKFEELVTTLAKKLKDLPSLSAWYISESDVRVNKPTVRTSTTSDLYYGRLSSGASVAITRVDLLTEKQVEEFKKHVELWYKLRDPHVLPFYGANNIAKPSFFVMARAGRGNFNEFLPHNPQLFWKVFLDAARGLAYLHSRSPPIVHNHLKCSNLLVMADGTGVVSDFAFAFARASSALSEKKKAGSSLNWRAPECIRPSINARVQSDVYSFGMCLFEALTGAPPYDGQTDEEILVNLSASTPELPACPMNKISNEAWHLIQRMCAADYHDRITMDGVIQYLEGLAERERLQRELLFCTCNGGVCSSCWKSTTSRKEDCP